MVMIKKPGSLHAYWLFASLQGTFSLAQKILSLEAFKIKLITVINCVVLDGRPRQN